MNKRITLFLITLLTVCGVQSQNNNQNRNADFHKWAETPPMGWNSWDCFGANVTEAEVKANADYMAEYLKDYGWEYIVVDIRWFVENQTTGYYNFKDPKYVLDEYGRLYACRETVFHQLATEMDLSLLLTMSTVRD